MLFICVCFGIVCPTNPIINNTNDKFYMQIRQIKYEFMKHLHDINISIGYQVREEMLNVNKYINK